MARTFPTAGQSPVDVYLEDPASGRAAGYFEVVGATASSNTLRGLSVVIDYEAAVTGLSEGILVNIKKTSGTLTDVLPVGIRIMMQELGNSGGYVVPLRIEKYNTTAGSLDCFAQFQNHAGTTTNGIYIGGTNKPTYWLFFQTDIANGCYTKGEGVTGEKMGALAVKFGTVVRYIRLYNSAS